MVTYDTSLRDGGQGEGIDFSVRDMLGITARLDASGFHYIEGGWPGSNPRHAEFFQEAKKLRLKRARLVAFASTRRPGIKCHQDKSLRALIAAGTKAVAIFGKSWILHTELMKITLGENLKMIGETVRYLKRRGKEVIYDAEHFFDGYKGNPGYALETLLAALRNGADWLVLCDTNGGTMPNEVGAITAEVARKLRQIYPDRQISLGIHAHNDCGLAVANSLSAVQAGARMVQGTINGFGERTGNADLTAVIPNAQLKLGFTCLSAKELAGLKGLSLFVYETANLVPNKSQPWVGDGVATHKAGVHVSAVLRDPRSYEHSEPELVGNHRRILVSDLSGRGNIKYEVQRMGLDLLGQDASAEIVQTIKRLEHEGHQFDVAGASLEILLRKCSGKYQPLFELVNFMVIVEKYGNQPSTAKAIIKIRALGREALVVGEGDGPINALDNALREALKSFYPKLDKVRLVDYKVRVINGQRGAASKVRVLITTGDQTDTWGTVGVSTNIIEASWQALVDGYEYKLNQQPERRAKKA